MKTTLFIVFVSNCDFVSKTICSWLSSIQVIKCLYHHHHSHHPVILQSISSVHDCLPTTWFLTIFSHVVRLLPPPFSSSHILVDHFFYCFGVPVQSSPLRYFLSFPKCIASLFLLPFFNFLKCWCLFGILYQKLQELFLKNVIRCRIGASFFWNLVWSAFRQEIFSELCLRCMQKCL